jgi:hypothetical protein
VTGGISLKSLAIVQPFAASFTPIVERSSCFLLRSLEYLPALLPLPSQFLPSG